MFSINKNMVSINNSSNNKLNVLASLFNKQNTYANDITRLKNIHTKINHGMHILNQITPIPKQDPNLNNELIYNLNNNNINISKIMNMNITREYYNNINIDNVMNIDNAMNIYNVMNIDNVTTYKTVHFLKQKGITKIIHVYQEKYINQNTTGFGDFIRSCFFIIQFCNKHNFQIEIIINHPIAYYLKNFSNKYTSSSFFNMVMFSENNFDSCKIDNENYIVDFVLINTKMSNYINYLSKLPVVNNSVISYNIFFPYGDISIQACNKICDLFEPSTEISNLVDEIINHLLIVKKDFIVIHIRSGDSYLKNNNKLFSVIYIESIKNEIKQIIVNNKDKNVLLIADNNEIKILLKNEIPKLKYLLNCITHIGEGVELNKNKVKNTLIDFYLMSFSSFIYSFTAYRHGSGFSYWCAKMNNIPYKCKYIK